MSRVSLLRLLAVPLLLAFAVAASGQPAGVSDQPFFLEGRISIRHADVAYHGSLTWQHAGMQDEILMVGPLGQGIVEMRRNPSGAMLRGPDGAVHEAESIDSLAERLFGGPLPLSQLPGWLRGIAPDASTFDEAGRPRALFRDGWAVEWLRYGENGKPKLIVIEGQGIALRLSVDSLEDVAPEPVR